MAFQLLEHNQADQAIPLLQESLRRNPADSFAHWYLSAAYRYGGALEQSVAEGELALKLNPKVAENLTFNTYLYVGQYRKFLDSLRGEESNARTVFYRGLAYYYLRDTRKSEEEFDRAFALNSSLLHAKIGRALDYALRHEDTQGLELMGSVERSGSDDGEMLYKMAQAYAQLGDEQSALRLLRRSIELNFYPYTYFVQDPLLEPARGEPEYSAVMELARQRREAFLKRLQ
jgi:tetratricopeptide (TPR) repeat protein